jgi:hypothetical protein
MVGQLLPNTNEMLQYAALQHSDFGGAELAQAEPKLTVCSSCLLPLPKNILMSAHAWIQNS